MSHVIGKRVVRDRNRQDETLSSGGLNFAFFGKVFAKQKESKDDEHGLIPEKMVKALAFYIINKRSNPKGLLENFKKQNTLSSVEADEIMVRYWGPNFKKKENFRKFVCQQYAKDRLVVRKSSLSGDYKAHTKSLKQLTAEDTDVLVQQYVKSRKYQYTKYFTNPKQKLITAALILKIWEVLVEIDDNLPEIPLEIKAMSEEFYNTFRHNRDWRWDLKLELPTEWINDIKGKAASKRLKKSVTDINPLVEAPVSSLVGRTELAPSSDVVPVSNDVVTTEVVPTTDVAPVSNVNLSTNVIPTRNFVYNSPSVSTPANAPVSLDEDSFSKRCREIVENMKRRGKPNAENVMLGILEDINSLVSSDDSMSAETILKTLSAIEGKLAGSKGPILWPEHINGIKAILKDAKDMQEKEEKARKDPVHVECMAVDNRLYRAAGSSSLAKIFQQANNAIEELLYGPRFVVTPSSKPDDPFQRKKTFTNVCTTRSPANVEPIPSGSLPNLEPTIPSGSVPIVERTRSITPTEELGKSSKRLKKSD